MTHSSNAEMDTRHDKGLYRAEPSTHDTLFQAPLSVDIGPALSNGFPQITR